MFSVDPNRVSGLIKSFFQERQYGFILYEDENGAVQEVFYHVTEFRPNLTPQAGQIAEFYLSRSNRGLRATECVLLRNNAELYKHERFMRLSEALQKTFSANPRTLGRPVAPYGTAVPQPIYETTVTAHTADA